MRADENLAGDDVAPLDLGALGLPEPVVSFVEAFRLAGRRLVLVGPVARALARGEDVGALRRFEFVTDIDRAALRRTVVELAKASRSLRPEEGRGRAGLTLVTPDGEVRVQVTAPREPTRGEAEAARRSQRRGRSGGPHDSDDPILGDLASREITIHAIGVAEDGTILDPFDGRGDLAARRLRTIVPPDRLGEESPRWILRLARHVGYYGHDVDPDVLAAARRECGAIIDLPVDLWRTETQRALLHRYPDRALQYLEAAGLLAIILPEVAALVGFERSCPVHHKDIWEHTTLVVHRSKPDPAQRWTALLHDVGKFGTRTVDPDGTVHFFRHEELSAILFAGIAARLRFPRDLADKVFYLVRNHSRVNLYSEDWSESAVRRLIREVDEHLDDLLAFSRADITSRREERVEYLRKLMDALEARIAEVRQKDARVPPLPKGIGNLIMQRFALPPSEVIGILRKRLEEAVEEGTLPRGLEADEYVDHLAKWLEEERQKSG